MPYYLGLSLLSTGHHNNCGNRRKGAEHPTLLSSEARRMLSRFEGGPIVEGDIAREALGRPFFPGRDTDFSVSHSGDLAAVSLVRGKNLRTGCDVEFVRPRPQAKAIAEEFFSAPERDYIESEGRFDETRFYEIWTLKECFLKLRGLSVFDMAIVPSFISSDGQFQFVLGGMAANFGQISFSLYEFTGRGMYILAAAFEGSEGEPIEIRWFSQGSLVCKSIANIKAAPSPAETVRPKI